MRLRLRISLTGDCREGITDMKKTGIIFDIQRFSLHDGPGIRTTVFLKGCPLRCKWCHNPESWSREPQLMFYKEKCVQCLECTGSCSKSVHVFKQGKHIPDYQKCDACGECIASCAYGALKLSGEEMDVDTVLKEVGADKSYYENSGGGLTVSGGEPMLQFSFSEALLGEAKKLGLHTCLETGGFAGKEQFARIAGNVDLFLYDMKHINDEAHKKYTGVSNQIILDNLDYLYHTGSKIRLRCPIIPGINDTDEHIGGIASLARKYPKLTGVEILPYHDMGKGKWNQIGKVYELSDLKNTDQEQKDILLRSFLKAGCEAVMG